MLLSKNIISDIFNISIHKNSYYLVEIFDKKEFSLSDLKQLISAQLEMGSRKLPTIFLFGKYSIADIETLKHMAKVHNCPYSTADAFVINSVSQKIICNFYIKIVAPERPTSLFTTREDALKWLKQFN
jgi:hypothetical protein